MPWFAIHQHYLEYGTWWGMNTTAHPPHLRGRSSLLLNHLELSGLFTTVTQAIAARRRSNLKGRLVVIIGRTLFRQKICCDTVLGLVEWRATCQKRPTRLKRREARDHKWEFKYVQSSGHFLNEAPVPANETFVGHPSPSVGCIRGCRCLPWYCQSGIVCGN